MSQFVSFYSQKKSKESTSWEKHFIIDWYIIKSSEQLQSHMFSCIPSQVMFKLAEIMQLDVYAAWALWCALAHSAAEEPQLGYSPF